MPLFTKAPLPPTPFNLRYEAAMTPNLYAGTPGWGTPSWGGDDARILQDCLASRLPQYSGVTPRGTQNSSMRPRWAPSSSVSKGTTPRVFFKDQAAETMDAMHQSTPEQTLVSSPCRIYNHRIFATNSSFLSRMSILDLQVVKSNEDIGTPFTGTGIATPARKCKPGIVTGSGPERNR